MAESKDENLKVFKDVTGADDSQTKFYLESANWQLEVALSTYFEQNGAGEDMDSEGEESSEPPQREEPAEQAEPPPPPPPKRLPSTTKPMKVTRPQKPATILDLNQSSSDDEEEGQAFFAGGSERSGQQIIGPPKKKDFVSEMFKSARERGALIVDEAEPSSGPAAFSGVGYRLGQAPDDHVTVAPPPADVNAPRTVVLKLYRDGFVVDDGALREYADPRNAEFLTSVRQGSVPLELAGEGREVHINLEDHRHSECQPPAKPKVHAFTGKGQMLGSPTGVQVVTSAPAAQPQSDRDANQLAAQQSISFDETVPYTTIQFRLQDGTRLIGRFNMTHTVGDLYQFVSVAEPQYQMRPFSLNTSFPSAELKDRQLTIEQAKLQNSLLVQRPK